LNFFTKHLNCNSLNNYFVYPSANSSGPSNSTDKFYDIGLFQLATSSNAVTTEIGELYVTYSFTMIRPRQNIPSGSNLLQAHIVEGAAGTAAAATPLGTTGGVIRSGSTLPTVCTTTTFTLPVAGSFLISSSFTGSAVATTTFSYGANIAEEKLMQDSTAGHVVGVSGGAAVGQWIVAVSSSGTGSANTVTIGGNTSLSGGADVFISQISTGLLWLMRNRNKTSHVVSEYVDDVKLLAEKCERLERVVRSLVIEVEDIGMKDLPPVVNSPPVLSRDEIKAEFQSPSVIKSRFGLF